VLKNRLPKNFHYTDENPIEFAFYENPRQLKFSCFKNINYIYMIIRLGVLDKEYKNDLNLEIDAVKIRTEDSDNLNDEVSAKLEELVTIEQ
jgi:hypothetical protein